MIKQSIISGLYPYIRWLIGLSLLLGLYMSHWYSYLLFHSLAEMFSIVIACGLAMIVWNTHRFLDSRYLLFLGITYPFIAGLDLLHTLAYKGMGVFAGYDADLPTQLWIAARYMHSLSLFIAALLINPRFTSNPAAHRPGQLSQPDQTPPQLMNTGLVLFSYTLLTAFLLGTIFYWDIFPTCYIEGVGLTPFKVVSEYIISLLFLASLILLLKQRQAFEPNILRLLALSTLALIGAELAFTSYVGVYDFTNLLGHIFKIVAYYLLYLALIETGLRKPYHLLYRELTQNTAALQESEEKYRRLAENAPDIIYRYRFGSNPGFEYVNPAVADVTGYTPTEHYTNPDLGFKMVYPGDQTLLEMTHFAPNSTGQPLVLRWIHKNGEMIWTEHRLIPVYDAVGQLIAIEGIARDITERKEAEEALQNAVAEKIVMLREIHHRVKNNLQVITHLIGLQADQAADSKALPLLKNLHNRVMAMALVHDQLYQSQNLARIDCGAYLEKLTANLHQGLAHTPVKISVKVDNLFLSVDQAIPCGLIVTELVTNALKYAFPPSLPPDQEKRTNEIRIELRQNEKMYTLLVGDNGVGLPPEANWSAPQSLGLELVQAWATYQLKAAMSVENDPGTTFTIQFTERDAGAENGQ